MMQWVRGQRRSLAAAVLVSLTVLGLWSTATHARDCHDDDCAVIAVHDGSAHAFRSTEAPADAHPLHCVLCHWARSIRPPVETHHHVVAGARPVLRVHVAVVHVAQVFPAAQPPLRSPPLSPIPVALA